MTEEQYSRAEAIIKRTKALKKALEEINIDLGKARSKSSNEKYYISGTSLVIYKEDTIILLSNHKHWLTSEIEFLEKQLKII